MATIETRHNTEGKTAYHVKIRLKGHPPQYASFTRLTDARRWAQSTEAAIREGRHFKTSEAKRRIGESHSAKVVALMNDKIFAGV